MKLTEKTALITGAGQGIGEAIARRFAEDGASVILCARRLESVEPVASNLRAAGHAARAIPADISQEADVSRLVRSALDTDGQIDVLINNAGYAEASELVATSTELWDETFAVNLRGPFLLCRAVLPSMIERRAGSIVNISSRSAKRPHAGWAAYSIAKYALIGLTETLAPEVKPYGIRVNAIRPGPTATAMRRRLVPRDDPTRLLDPGDVARAALFLASDEAAMVSGTVIDLSRAD